MHAQWPGTVFRSVRVTPIREARPSIGSLTLLLPSESLVAVPDTCTMVRDGRPLG